MKAELYNYAYQTPNYKIYIEENKQHLSIQ